MTWPIANLNLTISTGRSISPRRVHPLTRKKVRASLTWFLALNSGLISSLIHSDEPELVSDTFVLAPIEHDPGIGPVQLEADQANSGSLDTQLAFLFNLGLPQQNDPSISLQVGKADHDTVHPVVPNLLFAPDPLILQTPAHPTAPDPTVTPVSVSKPLTRKT